MTASYHAAVSGVYSVVNSWHMTLLFVFGLDPLFNPLFRTEANMKRIFGTAKVRT